MGLKVSFGQLLFIVFVSKSHSNFHRIMMVTKSKFDAWAVAPERI